MTNFFSIPITMMYLCDTDVQPGFMILPAFAACESDLSDE